MPLDNLPCPANCDCGRLDCTDYPTYSDEPTDADFAEYLNDWNAINQTEELEPESAWNPSDGFAY